MGDYGKRACMSCGKPFTATYPAQVTCSKTCAVARKRDLAKHDSRRFRLFMKEYVRELEFAICTYRKEYRALCELYNKTIEDVRSIKEGISRKKAPDHLTMKECKRFSLKATTLPCGEREECRGCPDNEKEKDLKPGERICKSCGKPFMPNSETQTVCSKGCNIKSFSRGS